MLFVNDEILFCAGNLVGWEMFLTSALLRERELVNHPCFPQEKYDLHISTSCIPAHD